MKPKKSAKANLENKRGLFLQIGLVVALVFCLVVFSQGKEERGALSDYAIVTAPDDYVLPPVTTFPEPPKPQIKMIPVADVINIVKNDKNIDTDIPGIEPEGGVIYVPKVKVTEKPVDEPEYILRAEVMPKFEGGDLVNFRKWVQERIKYPTVALDNRIQGRVTLSFIVDKNGRVTHIEILNAPDRSLGDEAARVVQSAPGWSPGLQGGIPVRVKFNLPVEFKIQ